MNDLRRLARIVLIGLALYILLRHGMELMAALPYLIFAREVIIPVPMLISYVVLIVFAGVIIYLCIYRPGWLAAKIVGPEEPAKTLGSPVAFAFRLVAVFAGLLYLYWALPGIIQTVHSHWIGEHQADISPRWLWEYEVSHIILLVLSIYFLCGAPHFVRWQVKKTLEQGVAKATPKDS